MNLQKGDLFEKTGRALRLGDVHILLNGAADWTPARPDTAGLDAGRLRARLGPLSKALESRADPPGLGELARVALSGTDADPPAPASALARRALPHARTFAGGLQRGDASLLREGARGLVGLGPGLTPAGDDFLGGWLTALRSAEGRGFEPPELDGAAGAVRALAAGRTTAISEALLGCALEGASSEPIHELLGAVLGGPAPAGGETLSRLVREVLRRGHSSGWDALAGIAWGLQSLLERLGAKETGG